ncbi:hypothetical protein B5D80_10150 [Micromonospora wenchangensis]|uniref:Uncharacterized protein n=1 Tax=Micromonospora wenchangensis TaxID=1185415 RepID=A0A246RR32_9ACTN|nr:hypothetical protein [Micromonospora wenchangensis]OWV09348.1 hypothetical protein B5D80_10150 [Micromonospora wenchangensis]
MSLLILDLLRSPPARPQTPQRAPGRRQRAGRGVVLRAAPSGNDRPERNPVAGTALSHRVSRSTRSGIDPAETEEEPTWPRTVPGVRPR